MCLLPVFLSEYSGPGRQGFCGLLSIQHSGRGEFLGYCCTLPVSKIGMGLNLETILLGVP